MTTQGVYSVAGLKLLIVDEGAALFPFLDEELGRYRSAESDHPDCEMICLLTDEVVEIPRGAQLVGRWHSQQLCQYKHGETDILHFAGRAVLTRNFVKRKVSLKYRTLDDSVRTAARITMKWLLIKTAEQQGYTYVHASAVRIQDTNIAFVGDSGCGKSSSLLRMCQLGATILTDDCLLLKDGAVHPFCLRMTVCGDFAKRFAIDSPASSGGISLDIDAVTRRGDLDAYICRLEDLQQIQAVYFPSIWNSSKSTIEPVPRDEAQQRLLSAYRKEVTWNAYPECEDLVAMRYQNFLTNATCYRLRAGNDEQAVRKLYIEEIANA